MTPSQLDIHQLCKSIHERYLHQYGITKVEHEIQPGFTNRTKWVIIKLYQGDHSKKPISICRAETTSSESKYYAYFDCDLPYQLQKRK